MKKILILAATAALALSVFSCDSISLTAPKMDTAEGLQKAIDAIKLDFNEYKPIEILISEGEKLENEVRIVSVSMVSNNKSNYRQAFIVHGAGKGAGKLDGDRFNSETYDFNTMEWIDPREVNTTEMASKIHDAKAQIPAGYSFESVGTYTIEIKNGRPAHKFDLLVTEDGNRTKKSAGQSVIEYYELKFDVLEDGSVYCQDLDL